MSKEEIILRNRLNRSESRCQDLDEQLNKKKQQWKKLEETFREAEFHCRKLCEEILVKDSSEIVLGKMYSWDGLTLAELAVKALASFRKYNSERTDLQRRLLDISEERRVKIDSLQEQIEVMRNYPGSIKKSDMYKEKDQKQETVSERQSEENKSPVPSYVAAPPVVEMIIEEDADIQEADIRDIQEMEKLSKELEPVQREIPVHPAKKTVRAYQKGKKQKNMAHMIDLSEYQNKITKLMWTILEIIGKEGISAYTEIEGRINELTQDEVTKATVRMSVRSLYSMGILVQEQVSDPLRSKFMVYRMSEIGQRLFKEHFKQIPVLSELDKIISQHDNPNHGYGIRALWTILTESGNFDTVSMDRKENSVKLRRGGIYIPDIVAKKADQILYMEYECGTHVQSDYSAKCNKMVQVTDTLYIVTPNRDVLQKRIMNQTGQWINEKGGYKALEGKKVCLTTATALKHENPLDEQCWQVVYNMTSDTPIVRM